MSKGAKIKLMAFVCGFTRNQCFFLNFGDYLVLQPDRVPWEEEEADWLIPDLQKTNSPGTTVGNFIRDLQVVGGSKAYADVAVAELPSGANAGGLRPGAINALAAIMPPELTVHATGQDLRGLSAMWEYIDCSRALAIPAAAQLAGWDLGMHHCRMGSRGPVPPSLEPLLTLGVPPEALDRIIDTYFRLDSAVEAPEDCLNHSPASMDKSCGCTSPARAA